MATIESIAYLKGLMDGLEMDENSKEAKIFNAIVDVLDELSIDVDDLTEGMEMMAEQLDAVDEDLEELEEEFYDDDCDCDCCDDCEEYEIECPSCKEVFYVDEDTVLDDGSVNCPSCGENLEFEVDLDEDEESTEE